MTGEVGTHAQRAPRSTIDARRIGSLWPLSQKCSDGFSSNPLIALIAIPDSASAQIGLATTGVAFDAVVLAGLMASASDDDGQNEFAPNLDRHRTAQDFEQDAHATGIIETIEDGKLFGERASRQANLGANHKLLLESQKTIAIYGRYHHLHDAARHRMRQIALHHEARHSERAIDPTPRMARRIEFDEQIARKKCRFDVRYHAGVPDGFQPLWQKHPKALALKLRLCVELAPGLGMDDIPPHVPNGRSGSPAQDPRIRQMFARDPRHRPPELWYPATRRVYVNATLTNIYQNATFGYRKLA